MALVGGVCIHCGCDWKKLITQKKKKHTTYNFGGKEKLKFVFHKQMLAFWWMIVTSGGDNITNIQNDHSYPVEILHNIQFSAE